MTYVSSVDGITTPGDHDVAYEVVGGEIVSATVDGEDAMVSGSTITGQYGTDGGGLTIRADNLADGSYSGVVSVKQGKIGQMADALADLTDSEDGILVIIEGKLRRDHRQHPGIHRAGGGPPEHLRGSPARTLRLSGRSAHGVYEHQRFPGDPAGIPGFLFLIILDLSAGGAAASCGVARRCSPPGPASKWVFCAVTQCDSLDNCIHRASGATRWLLLLRTDKRRRRPTHAGRSG